MLLTGALLLFYATCVSAEVSQRRGGVSQRTGGRASAQKTLTFGNGALPTTRSPTGPPTEPPTFDWTQCKSEGGTKNCAKCKGGDLDDNGALPCDSASVDCPDNKLWKGSYFFHDKPNRRRPTGKPSCSKLSGLEEGYAICNYNFPGIGGNSLVATKVLVAHPDGASENVGVVMFKRMVMHRCTAKSAVCKQGAQVADVFKQGFCVQCQSKKYTLSCPKEYTLCPIPNPDEGRWAGCGSQCMHAAANPPWFCGARRRQAATQCMVFYSSQAKHATTEQKRAFAGQCLTEAFTPEGIMKDDYQCSKEDMKYASASIAMF